MSKEHLTYFKVENFKRFDSLELTDIGQFNLIVGDNNVGKTSVLEALLFDTDRKKCMTNLHKTLFLKGLNIRLKLVYGTTGEVIEVHYPEENFLRYIFKDLKKSIKMHLKFKDLVGSKEITIISSDYKASFERPDAFALEANYPTFLGKSPDNRYVIFEKKWDEKIGTNAIVVMPKLNTEIAGVYEHQIQTSNVDFPLISTSLPGNNALPKAYFEQVDLSRKEKKQLIEDMRFLLPEIEDFEVRKVGGEDQLLVGMKGIDELMPITVFGESVTRATHILLEISKYRGKRLMIDEIDTGIHYSRMKHFLKTIFQIADKNEVQLFMTTHSLECQQAFAEVFEEADMVQHQTRARQFTLIEKPDGQVTAIKRDWKQLEFALETDNETRGGKLAW